MPLEDLWFYGRVLVASWGDIEQMCMLCDELSQSDIDEVVFFVKEVEYLD